MQTTLLLHTISWDTDGVPPDECLLPDRVLVVHVPNIEPIGRVLEYIDNELSQALSDAFGFCHNGFVWEVWGKPHTTHAGGGFFPDRLGVMSAPSI